MSGIKEIAQHPIEIEIDEPGLGIEKERAVQQHSLKGNETFG